MLLLSLRIMWSRASIWWSLLFHYSLLLNNIPLCGSSISIYPFIHSFIDGQLGYFHFSAILNNVAMSTCVQDFVQHMFSVFLDIYLGVELLGCMVPLCLAFWVTARLFSSCTIFLFLPAAHEGFKCSTFSLALVCHLPDL